MTMIIHSRRDVDNLIKKLHGIYASQDGSQDPEEAHIQADNALLSYIGSKRVTRLFEGIKKLYA